MVRYYSSYYRKLLGVDSPTGHLLLTKRRTVKRKKRRISKPTTSTRKMPKGYGLIITKKKKPVKKIKIKKVPLRKAKIGYSRQRRGQLAMKPQDIYEKQMIQRIQRKSGMTYFQAIHLVKKARERDIDIEHKIDWKLSKDRSEQYEQALKQLHKEINPIKTRSIRDLMAEASMYGF